MSSFLWVPGNLNSGPHIHSKYFLHGAIFPASSFYFCGLYWLHVHQSSELTLTIFRLPHFSTFVPSRHPPSPWDGAVHMPCQMALPFSVFSRNILTDTPRAVSSHLLGESQSIQVDSEDSPSQGVVEHACNPSTHRGAGGSQRIQPRPASKVNLERLRLHRENLP